MYEDYPLKAIIITCIAVIYVTVTAGQIQKESRVAEYSNLCFYYGGIMTTKDDSKYGCLWSVED